MRDQREVKRWQTLLILITLNLLCNKKVKVLVASVVSDSLQPHVQHEALTNEDLMELEAQRKDEERQEEEVTEEPKIHDAGNGMGMFFI